VEPAEGNTHVLARAARQRWHIPPDAPLVVFFGFLHPVKGLEYLVRAIAQVATECESVRLVLAGGWRSLALPESEGDVYAERLQALVRENGLESRVTLTGYLPAAEVSALLHAADVVALPFTYGIGLKSGSLVAALAHGRAVVGTQPGLPDPALRPGEHLVCVPPRDAEALGGAITRLLADSDLRQWIARSGARAVREHCWSAIAARHVELYTQIGAGSGSRNLSAGVPAGSARLHSAPADW
jgi:glycosyltransferase involved in cell wall biosynthesis